ncbi:MAG: hypothetical protein H7Y17_03650 [Chlorobia bacterium]|nr:hypothetical protein [Fimbriimonadaceae bacterium]
MRINIYASFNDTTMAKDAVGALIDHGVAKEDVGLVLPVDANADMAKENNRAEETLEKAESGITTTTQDDAMVGATKGAFFGFGIGSIAALAAILIPGVGLIVGGGALATALIGAGAATVAGSVAGGVVGYLKDQGVPEEESQRFSNVYEKGGAIVNVSAPSGGVDAATIEMILMKYGETAVEIWKTDPVLEPMPVA